MALAGYPAAWALHGALATVLDSLDRAAAVESWRRAARLDPLNAAVRLRLAERLALRVAGTLWEPELDAGSRDPWLDHLGALVNSRVALHFELPDWLLPVPGLVNVNLSMTEFDRVPPAWVERARWHDLLVLPTESASARSAATRRRPSWTPRHPTWRCPTGVPSPRSGCGCSTSPA
ncbi:hypothetical protein HL658_35260 [Azospirillum sp. RWY-5-1]|uniref:Uncharacterized protein n=1 Tax=Azospirillum oleiclasticum TaxID=2735135 RepID=A0ABX2TL17_9PROT|nr:hypothetical protein [Azospirillum oleiclasticum]NYZ17831.1 hypothetical protein [Azospirillum oleiclasticum]NYZ25037.1 hypothetical protein [Azospirillum oleiclasticum]